MANDIFYRLSWTPPHHKRLRAFVSEWQYTALLLKANRNAFGSHVRHTKLKTGQKTQGKKEKAKKERIRVVNDDELTMPKFYVGAAGQIVSSFGGLNLSFADVNANDSVEMWSQYLGALASTAANIDGQALIEIQC